MVPSVQPWALSLPARHTAVIQESYTGCTGARAFSFRARDGHDWGDAGWTRASGSWSFAFWVLWGLFSRADMV